MAVNIVTGSTYIGTLCVRATLGRDASTHRTVYIATHRQRRQGVSRHNKPFPSWTAKSETQRQTTWTFFSGGAIGKHNYILKLPATLRLHLVFHVNNLRPICTAPLRPAVPVTIPEGDDEEFDVSQISAVCVKSLPGRRGKYLLFMTHFSDDDIPLVWHRLNEVHRTTTLQDFLETPQ
jgi:hypothetical protein